MENKSHGKLYIWWVNHSFSSLYFFAGFVCVLTYLISDYYDWFLPRLIAVCAAAFFIIIYLIHNNQRSLHGFLYNNEGISHLPKNQLRNLNKVFMAIFLVITSAIMLIFVRLPYGAVLSWIWSGIKSFLRFIFSFIKNTPSGENTDIPVQQEPLPLPGGFLIDETQEVREPSIVWDYIITIFAILVLAALLCYAVYSIYKKIVTRERKELLEERELISPFSKKERADNSAPRKDNLLRTGLSYNMRIRRLYRREILERAPVRHCSFEPLTPEEIEKQAGLGSSKYDAMLHETYEKARYSEHGCTRQEYKLLRKS